MAKLAVIKTKENDSSVIDFINTIQNEQIRKDSHLLLILMQKLSGEEPKMWGKSLIGFGKMRYKSPATGREVDWVKIGFSPLKAKLSLHLMNLQVHDAALSKLGNHKAGVGCLYINKLDDVDLKILEEILVATLNSN